MSAAAAIPGLSYTFVRPEPEPSPLRTDVAGFLGRSVRGPVGTAVRVEGWHEYASIFGGLGNDVLMPYALRGYFENDGKVAHVVRLLDMRDGHSQTAAATWEAGTFDAASGKLDPNWPGASGLLAIAFEIRAASPGDWANDTTIAIRYWATGASGDPEMELEIHPPNEAVELLSGIAPVSIADQVNARSAYVRMCALPLPSGLSPQALTASRGPSYRAWGPIALSGGKTEQPTKEDYLEAVQALSDQTEVALVSCPDLHQENFTKPDDAIDVLAALLTQADQLHDRLVLIDVPPDQAAPIDAVKWIDQRLRKVLTANVLQSGAVYHPGLLIRDPLGSVASPLRSIPCSGLVAGVISRLDTQLGAYSTPANAPINQAVDLSQSLDAEQQAILYAGGLNLLRCSPGRGLLVWGGRVLGKASPGGYVAHRRLIHLLVRAIRRVAEPLVFDTNGPLLWLVFVRSITSVLLEAFRAGALKGDTPDQAFGVKCDATNNPPEQIDQGMVTCEIRVAPAVPMEFITLRVSVSAQGQLEVFES